MKPAYELADKPKLLFTDGAGTLFDPGSIVPAYAFQLAFRKKEMDLEIPLIMKYMGRDKKKHIALLLAEESVLKQFQNTYQRTPNEQDILAIYNQFKKELYPSAARTEEIPQVKEAAFRLKAAGIPIVMTTGYDREMVQETEKKLPWLKELLTASYTSSDVARGRPFPYLIYRAMEAASIQNPAQAIKAGDTLVDTESADNANMPAVTVLSGSVNKDEAEQINPDLRRQHLIVDKINSLNKN